MASIVLGYEYDIFISYRHNDNQSGWVTEFVKALQEELAAAIKEPVSVYFDINPHDGLKETHDVDESLKEKLKCLVFIPIISQTYCDQKSFAWKYEFLTFREQVEKDSFGLKVKLQNGNVASRILPVRIHELDSADLLQIETALGSVLRPVDFIYSSRNVVRPLLPNEIDPKSNQEHIYYRDQMNKVVRAIKELITSMKSPLEETKHRSHFKEIVAPARRKKLAFTTLFILLGLVALGIYFFSAFSHGKVEPDKSIAVLPFDDLSPE